ncbi:hypothetical protein MHYP_G00201930 [Metynnis hypsauchen]
MDQTFPLRRREIVEEGPPVKTLKERWPALFTERQVFAEFNRIATTNLQNNFFDAMDRYTPRFVTIFKSEKGTVGETLAEFVQQIDLRDADSDEAWAQASAGVLTVISEDVPLCPNHLHLDAVSTAIIVEGDCFSISPDMPSQLPTQCMCGYPHPVLRCMERTALASK